MPLDLPAVGRVWDELEVSFPLLERVHEPACLLQQGSEGVDDDRAIRHKPRGLLVMGDRQIELPAIRIEEPKARMSKDQIRSEAEGLLIFRDSLIELASLSIGRPKVDTGIGVMWSEAESLLMLEDRLIDLPDAPQRIPQVRVSARQFWIGLEGPLIGSDRLLGSVCLEGFIPSAEVLLGQSGRGKGLTTLDQQQSQHKPPPSYFHSKRGRQNHRPAPVNAPVRPTSQ
jgi:hypothetical protein